MRNLATFPGPNDVHPADPPDWRECVCCGVPISEDEVRCERHQMLADLTHDQLVLLADDALYELSAFDIETARMMAPGGVLR